MIGSIGYRHRSIHKLVYVCERDSFLSNFELFKAIMYVFIDFIDTLHHAPTLYQLRARCQGQRYFLLIILTGFEFQCYWRAKGWKRSTKEGMLYCYLQLYEMFMVSGHPTSMNILWASLRTAWPESWFVLGCIPLASSIIASVAYKSHRWQCRIKEKITANIRITLQSELAKDNSINDHALLVVYSTKFVRNNILNIISKIISKYIQPTVAFLNKRTRYFSLNRVGCKNQSIQI